LKSQKRKRKVGSLDDRRARRMFLKILRILRNSRVSVHKVHSLRSPYDARRVVLGRTRGLFGGGKTPIQIFINADLDPTLDDLSPERVLLHESLHILLGGFAPENSVLREESKLWNRLSEKDRALLGKFIPIHSSSLSPRGFSVDEKRTLRKYLSRSSLRFLSGSA